MISIIGAGKVGSMAAFNILGRRISDVILIDVQENLAHGEALDMIQAAPAIEFDGKINGTCDFSEMKNSEVVIVTAGHARQPGMSRTDLAVMNAKIVRSITLRFRSYIAQELGVSREDIRALVIGEHGNSMVPLVDYACVSGIPIRTLLDENQIEKIINKTRTSGADVIKLKGSTVYAPAAAIAIMADAILKDRNRVLGISTYLEGAYGFSDVAVGVPCVLGKNGVERVIELKLDSKSEKEFRESVAKIKDVIGQLEEQH
ncbi:MAG: malate dehydrogenase [Deltaproteobacteria bacterium]|nr:malate dehydrogenase [Deltaproteobacteria bacterium]